MTPLSLLILTYQASGTCNIFNDIIISYYYYCYYIITTIIIMTTFIGSVIITDHIQAIIILQLLALLI